MTDLDKAIVTINSELVMLSISPQDSNDEWKSGNDKFQAMAALLVKCLQGFSYYDAKAIAQQFQFEINKASMIREH